MAVVCRSFARVGWCGNNEMDDEEDTSATKLLDLDANILNQSKVMRIVRNADKTLNVRP